MAFSVSPGRLDTRHTNESKKKPTKPQQHKKNRNLCEEVDFNHLKCEIIPYASLFFKKRLLFAFKYLTSDAQKSITEKLRSLKCLENATFDDRIESFYKGGNIIHWY